MSFFFFFMEFRYQNKLQVHILFNDDIQNRFNANILELSLGNVLERVCINIFEMSLCNVLI
jgi:hypothetical protein